MNVSDEHLEMLLDIADWNNVSVESMLMILIEREFNKLWPKETTTSEPFKLHLVK
jgi:hypothetical protein